MIFSLLPTGCPSPTPNSFMFSSGVIREKKPLLSFFKVLYKKMQRKIYLLCHPQPHIFSAQRQPQLPVSLRPSRFILCIQEHLYLWIFPLPHTHTHTYCLYVPLFINNILRSFPPLSLEDQLLYFFIYQIFLEDLLCAGHTNN